MALHALVLAVAIGVPLGVDSKTFEQLLDRIAQGSTRLFHQARSLNRIADVPKVVEQALAWNFKPRCHCPSVTVAAQPWCTISMLPYIIVCGTSDSDT
jgi:hypothetical protein